MSAEFRIIRFFSDPYLGPRFPVAAVFRERDRVHFVRAERLPDAHCLGGSMYAATLAEILQTLEHSPRFDQLPIAVGPSVAMMEPDTVPSEVTNVADWLTSHILPRKTAEDAGTRHPQAPRRSALGYSYFKSRKVDAWVKHNFRANVELRDMLPPEQATITRIVDNVSHWVDGSDEVLLMEPLSLTRKSFKKDVREVARNFLAYRHFLDDVPQSRKVSLVAYILPSHHDEAREQAMDTLTPCAHRVLDLHDPPTENLFLSDIRRIGDSRKLMNPLNF